LYCKHIQVWLQAAINAAPGVRPLLQQASEVERAILHGERAQTVQVPGGVWTSPIPLVLITSEYAPITALPRPVSRPPAGTADPLVWLDLITESGFLSTLHQATVISVSVSEHQEPPTRSAPGHPYDPQRGDGLRWTPGTPEQPGSVQLWEGGKLVAEAEHPIASAWRYWHHLEMGYDFEQVTHWSWFRPDRCQVRLTLTPPPAGAYPDPDHADGTIQFGDDTQPVLTWKATTAFTPQGRHQWAIAVPLPPDAEAPTLPLRIALAYQVFLLVVGEHRKPDWYEVAAVFPNDTLPQMLPDETGAWRLAEEAEPVRSVWVRALGIAPDRP
jgi:hypothetical protein